MSVFTRDTNGTFDRAVSVFNRVVQTFDSTD